MSTPSSSSVAMATQTPSSNSLGTGFLDLPFELRKMIYDLCFEKSPTWNYPLPGDPRPVVPGINLLRVCRQIYNDRSGYIWRNDWMIYFPLKKRLEQDTSPMNCTYAMSCLHLAALANLRSVFLLTSVHQNSQELWGPVDLRVLYELKSLSMLSIFVNFGSYNRRVDSQKMTSIEESPFLTGFIIQAISQIPRSSCWVTWHLYYWDTDGKRRSSLALANLAEKYKALRGSSYALSERNSLSDTTIVSVSHCLGYQQFMRLIVAVMIHDTHFPTTSVSLAQC